MAFRLRRSLACCLAALLRNASLNFCCRPQTLSITSNASAFTASYGEQREVVFPIAHHDGNYFADEGTLDHLEGEGRVAFRYVGNPNGSARDIAGILSDNRRVLGMMPHPETGDGGPGRRRRRNQVVPEPAGGGLRLGIQRAHSTLAGYPLKREWARRVMARAMIAKAWLMRLLAGSLLIAMAASPGLAAAGADPRTWPQSFPKAFCARGAF